MTGWCPRCARGDVPVKQGRFRLHSNTFGCCPMSEMPVPASGVAGADYERRAATVAELAFLVQDRDPAVVWEWLTAVPAVELQRLLVVALAAIDADKPVSELWGWVAQLPSARCSA